MSYLYPCWKDLRRRLKWYAGIALCCCLGYACYMWGGQTWFKVSLWGRRTDYWVANPCLKVGPYQNRVETMLWQRGKAVTLHAARGEHIAFQLVFASATPISGKVTITTNKAGVGTDPALACFREYYVTPTHLQRPGSTGAGEYPDALLPGGEQFAVEPYHNTVIWVEAEIPREFTDTEWHATLTIDLGDRQITLPLTVMVWRFALPAESHLMAFSEMYPRTFSEGEKVTVSAKSPHFKSLCQQYTRYAADHRLVLGWRGVNPQTSFDKETGALQSIDWTAYDALFDEALAANPSCWRAPIDENWRIDLTPADRRAIKEYVEAIDAHFTEKDWPVDRTIAYIYDEPEYAQLPSVSEYGAVFDTGSTRLRYFVATYPDATLHNVDDYSPLASDCYPPELDSLRKQGARIWFYQTEGEPHLPLEYIHTYGTAFCLWPWVAWRYDIDGVFLWGANYWTSTPYATLDDYYGNGEGIFFYPGAKLNQVGLPPLPGPVPSYRLKMLRRGMEDYEYLWLVAQHMGKKRADAFAERIVRSALCVRYNADGGYAGYWREQKRFYAPNGSKYAYGWEDPRFSGDWARDPEALTRIRIEMGTLLDNAIAQEPPTASKLDGMAR